MQKDRHTILITGGASGIGKHLAINLAKQNNQVLVLDKNIEAIKQLKSDAPTISSTQCDVTDFKHLNQVISQLYSHTPIDIVINNAGYIHSEPLVNLMSVDDKHHSISAWHKTISSNLDSTFYVTTCVVEKMVAQRIKGLIINISSVSASGNIGQSAYSAAKAGVNTLTATWSKELSMFGIRTAAIAPGFFDSESTRDAMSEKQLAKWKKNVPLNRLGELDEILSGVNFIIENDYFNGRILEIDGGLRI